MAMCTATDRSKAEGRCKLQVMAALREGRTSTPGMTNGSSTPMAATPRGTTPRANGRGGHTVAESVQQALLYVRFRTAAESGLKGDPLNPHPLPPSKTSGAFGHRKLWFTSRQDCLTLLSCLGLHISQFDGCLLAFAS